MYELAQCCALIIQLLTKLKEEGKLTQQEYEKHIRMKVLFLRQFEQSQKNIGIGIGSRITQFPWTFSDGEEKGWYLKPSLS